MSPLGPANGNWKGGRITTDGGYVKIRRPEHPRANSVGYVREHVVIAERVLGKALPDKAEVHHVNGDGTDNRNQNLVICQNNEYHKLLERRGRALATCGHANWRKCVHCKRYDDPQNGMYIKGPISVHRECRNRYQRAMRCYWSSSVMTDERRGRHRESCRRYRERHREKLRMADRNRWRRPR